MLFPDNSANLKHFRCEKSSRKHAMASVKVAVRVRPFNGREKGLSSQLVVQMTGSQVCLSPAISEGDKNTSGSGVLSGDRHKPHNFTFNEI